MQTDSTILNAFPETSNEEISLGNKIAWGAFLITSAYLIFLKPYIALYPGEREKQFFGLVCAITLILALVWGNKKALTRQAIWISGILGILPFLSALFSNNQDLAFARAFVMTASALGGFWCARLLLNTAHRQVFFQWYCLIMLVVVLVLAGVGLAKHGEIHRYVDPHWHPVSARILLLAFAPLALIASGNSWQRAISIIVLIMGYILLLLSGKYAGTESVIIIPVILCLIVVALRRWSHKALTILAILICLMSVAMGKLVLDNAHNVAKQHVSVAYRLENVFFSWHIASQHPFLGIGLWAHREPYLEEYEVTYPYITKERFSKWTSEFRTSENTPLTFLTDLGIPFVILYFSCVLFLMTRLLVLSFNPPSNLTIHPVALLLPLVGESLHLLIYEGLFQPQVSWFFHLLLGLVPGTAGWNHVQSIDKKALIMRLSVFIAASSIGVVLGMMLSSKSKLVLDLFH